MRGSMQRKSTTEMVHRPRTGIREENRQYGKENDMKIADRNGVLAVSFGAADSMEKQNKGNKRALSIFAGDLKQDNQETAVEKKRKEVRERAAKVLLDKFESDQEYEQGLDESRAKIQESQAVMKEARDNAEKAGERLKGLSKEEAPKEYKNCEEYIQEQQRIMQEAEGEIIGENASIRGAKQAKLGERYRMVDAVNQEQEILKAGSKEIMGVAIQESMNHIDEMYQENIEKAQEQKEKEEEQEEKLEDIKEKKEEIEQQVDAAKAEAAREQTEMTEEVNETVTGSADVDKELRKLQKEAELLDEEMKGLLVDSKA